MSKRTGLNIGVVVLNYNDANNTVDYVNRIKEYERIKSIIVVDNCSTDDSLERIKGTLNQKVELLSLNSNRGYAYGNNQGIKYLLRNKNVDIVCVSNPDIEYSEEFITAIINDFIHHPDISVLTGVQYDKDGNISPNAFWEHLNYNLLIRKLSHIWVINKIFKIDEKESELSYIKSRLQENEDIIRVPVISGCLFFIRTEDIRKVGLFDEETFLYYEEEILFRKIENNKLIAAVDKTLSFIHEGGGSTRNSFNRVETFRISCQSLKYYATHYVINNPLQYAFFFLLFHLYCFDREICYKIRRMRQH